MKKIFPLFIACWLLCINASGQQAGLPQPDKSPMDMSYFPFNYPVLKIQDKTTENPILRVIYSRPQKAGRTVFGELVEYGTVWRMGANEATEVEFFKNVRIGGKKISRGRYTLYAIVHENNWTIILNKETDTWGAFKYNSKKDIVRTDVPVQKTDVPIEFFSIATEKTISGCNLIIAWDKIKIALPINF
ncbi:MAG: DUF2911 domain-containing protein [Bacteroidota bacterium]